MTLATVGSFAGLGATIVGAAIFRNGRFAMFVGVLLTIHTLIAIELFPSFAQVWPAWAYLQGAVYLHFLLLSRARPKPSAIEKRKSGSNTSASLSETRATPRARSERRRRSRPLNDTAESAVRP